MKQSLKSILRKVADRVGLTRAPQYGKTSYSQQGEDTILDCLFQGRTSGFYVDVGAHHPQRFSNTCLFYERGWRGINIDATPGSMEAFARLRPGDINLECGVSEQRQTLTLHLFNEPALNGFAQDLSKQRDGAGHFRQVAVRQVEAMPLRELLAEHLPASRHIDFLSVDVEGFDLEVLRSNDWVKYRPTIVVAEEITAFVIGETFSASPLVELMRGFRYSPCGKAVHSIFFVAEEQVSYGADHSVQFGLAIGAPKTST